MWHSTSASQACGSMLFILAVTIRLYMNAARSPPRSEPANNHARRSRHEKQRHCRSGKDAAGVEVQRRRSTGISEVEKAAVTVACQRFIDEVLKPRFLPVIHRTEFNYPIDIHGKWHGARYRFIQRYRSGFPETMNQEFDSPFVRLDWVARDRFDIQW